MFEIYLIVLSYINLSSMDVNQYYESDISHSATLVEGVVVKDYYYDDYHLFSGDIISFEQWSNNLYRENFHSLLASVSAMRGGDKRRGGIIPDIDLSLNMPRGIANIIGEGGHISVDGSQKISIDISRNQRSSAIERKASAWPQIQLDSRLQARIQGTVGENIHISIDHDSEAREQSNKLKIWYEGDEDDILQKIDAGDVRGLGGGRNQDVFGIYTGGKFGSTSFDLTAGQLESKTSSKSESFSISSDSTSFFEKDYRKNTYFFTGISQGEEIRNFSLFIEKGNSSPTTLIKMDGDTVGQIGETFFRELEEGEDYVLRYLTLPDGSFFPYIKVIAPHHDKKLAMYYTYRSISGDIDTLGRISDTLTLYLLKSRDPDPSDPSWDLMMKNIYSFGSSYPTGVDVKIFKVVSGGDDIETDPQSGKEYVELLGLDSDGNGSIDQNRVIWEDGCIIFPESEPFLNSALGEDTVPVIYNEKNLQDEEGKNFRIVVTSTSEKREFYIGAGSLVDSSEVIVAGESDTLKRNVDYKINYETGRVTFTENANLSADSKITYTYDTQPLFEFTSRYIAKANVKAHPLDNTDLNMDFAFRASSNPEPYPKVGLEPSHMGLGKIQFSTKREPEVLNDIFRSIPFVSHDSKSRINVSGSYGVSMPNPATNGKSYIDDMESIKLSRNLELSAGLWNYCSKPPGASISDSLDIEMMGKIDWFNTRILKRYLFPDLPSSQTYQTTSAMVFYIQPTTTLTNPNPEESWSGIQRAFSSQEDFSEKTYLEVWVKGEDGEVVIDLGSRIKEDIPRWGLNSQGEDSLIKPNRRIDTEDRNGNFDLESGEDTGLDGINFDDDNWQYVPDSLDDGRDDYPDELKTFEDSIRLHRKEGNKRLDSEDLNRDHILETESDFYRYRIDLGSIKYLAKTGENGWKMYRIPLIDSTIYEEVGDPSFESILYSRIWFTGVDTTSRILIASAGIVGSRWDKKGIMDVSNDSLYSGVGEFLITYRNSFEDKDYVPPVEQEKDMYGNFTREQSLVLDIDSLEPNYYTLAETYLELPARSSGKGYDLRLYNYLRFFSRLEETDGGDSVNIFIRLLTDRDNYYQYSTLVSSDWDTLDIKFDRFYQLKRDNDSIQGDYSLRGSPTLKNIAYLQIGSINKGYQPFTGEVYFDDFILMGADKDRGSDLKLDINTNVGDLISNISYNLQRRSSKYKNDLDQLRQIGDKEVIGHNLSANLNAGRFTGDFFNFPIKVSYSNRKDIPLFKKNSDLKLSEEGQSEFTETDVNKRLVFNFSRPGRSENWLLRYTIDNLRFSGSLEENTQFSPEQRADTSRSRVLGANYGINLPSIPVPGISDKTTSILPSRISVSADYRFNKKEKYEYISQDSVYRPISIKPTKEVSTSGNLTYKPIKWVDFRYNISAKNDLLEEGRYGQNTRFSEGLDVSHHSSQFGLNDINITYSVNYAENHGVDYSSSLGDSLDVRSASQRRSIRITDNIKTKELLDKIPGLSFFSDKINPVRITTTFSRNNDYAYLSSTPGYNYRYGLDNSPSDTFLVQNSPNDGGMIERQYNVATGFQFSRIDLNISGTLTEREPDLIKQENSVSTKKIINFGFPHATIRIPEVASYVPGLNNIVRNSRLQLSINRDSSSTIGLGNQQGTSGSAILSINPSLNLKFKNDLGFTVDARYTSTDIHENKTYTLHTHEESKNITIQSSYTIRPGKRGLKIPLIGRIKLDRPVNLKAEFSYQDDIGFSVNKTTGNTEVSKDSRNMNFKLSGNYSFSDMVNGSLQFHYRNILNRKLDDEVTTTYGGMVDVILKF